MAKSAGESKGSFFQYMKLLLATIIISGIVFFLVFNNIKANRIEKDAFKVKQLIMLESKKQREKILTIEEMASRDKVQTYANSKLKIVLAQRNDYIYLR